MDASDIRIGQNIKALREAYGETEEDLAKALNFTGHQTINNYECGKRHVDDEKKILFMNHFDVTIEELMFRDFSICKKIKLDDFINCEAFGILLPIFVTDDALKNNDFKTAYELHKNLYDLCDNIPIGLDSVNNIPKLSKELTNIYTANKASSYNNIFQHYINAYNDKSVEIETSTNCIALYYLMKTFEKLTDLLLNKTAFTNILASELEDVISIIDETALTNLLTSYLKEQNLDYSFEELQTNSINSLNNRFSMLNSDATVGTINKMMTSLKQSKDFSDLADYYDAFSLFYTDGILSQKGYDQMEKLNSYGNLYAKRYLLANPNPNK